MRPALKKPLGELVKEESLSRSLLLAKVFSKKAAEDDVIVASIGDRTTERLEEYGFTPNLEIIDSVERRTPRSLLPWRGSEVSILYANNPAGGISAESLETLKKCSMIFTKDPRAKLRVVVSGEEDLLTLPVIAFMPGRVIAMYGQPGEGMVIADSLTSREACTSYLKEIGIVNL